MKHSQSPVRKLSVLRWQTGQKPVRQHDQLAAEEPLEIRVDTRPISVTMRTPGHDDELAAGFLLSEGLIEARENILKIRPHERNLAGNVIDVFLAAEISVDFEKLTRHVFASSSCGLCGKATIEAVSQQFKPVQSKWKITAETVMELPLKLRQAQETFSLTGGLHAAAVFAPDGKLLVLREDIGRHNAVDKVLGWALLGNHLPLARHVLVVSGRASFEIMQKALAAQLAVVAAISAPSTLAVQFARKSGQTLAGFVREGRMNLYSGHQRIVSN